LLTRRDLLNPSASPAALLRDLVRRRPVVVYEWNSLRQAADLTSNATLKKFLTYSETSFTSYTALSQLLEESGDIAGAAKTMEGATPESLDRFFNRGWMRAKK